MSRSLSPQHSFFITVSKGLEDVLREELLEILKDSPVIWNDPKVDFGGIGFKGTVEDALKICLHSRIATRVYLKLHEFLAPTPEKLYGGLKSIRWIDHFTNKETIAIDFVTKNSAISHTQFGAQKSKDAIVDQFKSVTGDRPSVDLKNPDIQIQIYLNNDIAFVNLDLSGRPLNERGYRVGSVDAPLKENLGAALLILSGWKEIAKEGGSFIDPTCGSGTLPIEAAMIANNIAPGSLRTRWGFKKWKFFDEKIWSQLVAAARAAECRSTVKIRGGDRLSKAVNQSIENAKAAGFTKEIEFFKKDFSEWTDKPSEKGLILCNPPYGERIGDEEDLIPMYRGIGDLFKKSYPGWKAGVFTGNALLAKEVGLKPDRRVPIWNASIECRLLKYTLFSGTRDPKKLKAAAERKTDED